MKSWVVEWNGEHVSTDDLSAGEAVLLQTLTGDPSWSALEPMLSPVHLVSLFTVVAARDVGLDAAQKAVHDTPLRDLLNAIEAVDGDGN